MVRINMHKPALEKIFAIWWLNDVSLNPQMPWIPFYINSCSSHCEHVSACKHFLPYSVGSPSCCCVHVVIKKCILTAIQSESLIEHWLQSILSPHSSTKIAAKRLNIDCVQTWLNTLCVYTDINGFISFFLPGRGKWLSLYWETTLRLCCPFYLSLLFLKGELLSHSGDHMPSCTEGLLVAVVAAPVLTQIPFKYRYNLWRTAHSHSETQLKLTFSFRLRQIQMLTEPLSWICSHSTADSECIVAVCWCWKLRTQFCIILYGLTHIRTFTGLKIFLSLQDLFLDFWYEHRTLWTLGLNIAFVIYMWTDFTCTPLRQKAWRQFCLAVVGLFFCFFLSPLAFISSWCVFHPTEKLSSRLGRRKNESRSLQRRSQTMTRLLDTLQRMWTL